MIYTTNHNDHSSRHYVTIALKRPTRESCGQHGYSLIWSCSWWGLPCHQCYHWCGALLPHHFTLTIL